MFKGRKMINKIKNLWNSSHLYQKILFFIGCISLISLVAFLLEIIDNGVKLKEVSDQIKEFKDIFGSSPDSVLQDLYNGCLTTFIISLIKFIAPMLFSITCFIFAFLKIDCNKKNIKPTIFEPNETEILNNSMLKKETEIINKPILMNDTINIEAINMYTPSSSVNFVVPENKTFVKWKSTVEYYKVPISNLEMIINEKLYCKPIDEKTGGIFMNDQMICSLHESTHYDFKKNYGNDYCFDCFILKIEQDYFEKELSKFSLKIYIPSLSIKQ